jgi:protein TonB
MLENNDRDRSYRRGLRRRALAISAALECAILLALVLWPVLDPAVLPKILHATPPPFHGLEITDLVHASGERRPSSTNSKPAIDLLDREPPRIPHHVSTPAVDDAPNFASNFASDFANGNPGVDRYAGPDLGAGPVIPGADRTTRPPEIKRPAEHTRRQQVSEGVMEAALVRRVLPTYPAIARPLRLSGQVVLHALIGTDGSVRQLQIVSGNMILAQAAVAAVREWRYQPTRLSGQPVEVETTITVNFLLEQN